MKWVILLSQYEMQFLPQKDIKGQALVDFLTENPASKAVKMYEELPDEVEEVLSTQTMFNNQVWLALF